MKDKQVIERLGGVKAIAEALGYNYTTVHNWLTRGIPAQVKLDHRDIFLSEDPNPSLLIKQPEEA